MAITGKTAIPLGDDPIVDHTQLQDGTPPAPAAVAAVSPPSFGSTPASGFGGTNNATATTGGFGSSGFGSSPAAGTSSFGSPQAVSFGGGSSSGFGGTTNQMGSTGTSNMNMSMSNAPVLTGAGNNAAMDADVLVKADEDWINKKWRPVMGWMYMVVCMMDFVVFPILWSLLQAFTHGNVTSQWQPLTLQGAGLFHIAMGAVLGIAAYGRTKEKVAGAN